MAKCVMTESAARGQKIVTSFGRDDSSYKTDGKKSDTSFGGGVTNLAHSLGTSAAHQDGNKGKKNKFD